jgi:hypothetical protein
MSISSNGHPAIADPWISLTGAGIVIDRILQKANARSPIFFSFDFSSSVTVAR